MTWVIPSWRVGGKRGQRGTTIQLPKHLRKTVKANTLAALPPHRLRRALPAHRLLAPGTHHLAIVLAGECLAGLLQRLAGGGKAHAGVLDQPTTAVDLDTADRRGSHTIWPSQEEVPACQGCGTPLWPTAEPPRVGLLDCGTISHGLPAGWVSRAARGPEAGVAAGPLVSRSAPAPWHKVCSFMLMRGGGRGR